MIKWHDLKSPYQDQLARAAQQDPYELLSLLPGSSIEQIKAAYRAKLKLYHPDKTDPFLKAFGTEMTKLLTAAYKTLVKDQGNA